MRMFRAVPAALLSAVVLACGVGPPGTATSRCGIYPTFQPTGAQTPQRALVPASPASTVGPVAVIGTWADCFRPETTTARPGQLVQWQAAEGGIAPEIVLEDGTSLGQIRPVLEFQFSRPGTYRYHMRGAPTVGGTIVVTETGSVPCDENTIRAAGERFFALFNQRKLDELLALFLPDARTYYVRRGDPVTGDFKESGVAEIRQMLSDRMASGETLQPAAIVTVSSGGSTVATGTFPDGASRRLDVKFGYDCRRPGIGQLLITPLG